ncbi:MAG: hypothetical protein GY859_40835 [Desulfobacterales bacterium]|nr:hypothetical protein [Desulfobacterales bacterium]
MTCHGGDPDDDNWQTAHKGVIKDPTRSNPDSACGECHPDIVATAPKSLHYTLAPFGHAIRTRAGDAGPKTMEKLEKARQTHCGKCHASCGQCHVSRPEYVNGGFLAKHTFKKTPPMETTCASCHGGRVFGEYTGVDEDFEPDIHYEEQEMTCMACHKSAEMHANADGVKTRRDLKQRPRCIDCHEEATNAESKIESHRVHGGKLACQVCHAQPVKQCFQCHVGLDKKGLPYYKCSKTKRDFKIGLNPAPTEKSPFTHVVLRHPPVAPTTFDFYVKNGLRAFDSLPTWKPAAPHNIRRRTSQNQSCNNCHGNAELFLQKRDVAPRERAANRAVITPPARTPKKIEPKP